MGRGESGSLLRFHSDRQCWILAACQDSIAHHIGRLLTSLGGMVDSRQMDGSSTAGEGHFRLHSPI